MSHPSMQYNNGYQKLYGQHPPPIEVYPVDRMWLADAWVYLNSEAGLVRVKLGSGTGLSKQEAKDAAARQAYEALRGLYPNAGLPAMT